INVDTTRHNHDRLITIGDIKIGLISGKEMLPGQKIDYALLCKGYRSGIAVVNDRFSPDTILLAADLNPRTAMRYINECNDLEIPYVNMRERKWSRPYPISSNPIVK
ncbi:MAG: hypothetical protein K2L85_02850, partial [Paramuribaculum sp.]|nr:hypothetical protein [Paramuribaculum sp.]